MEYMTSACSESCAHHSGWSHTLHFPHHWTEIFRGPGWLRVLTIVPLQVVMHVNGTRKSREGKGEARVEGGPLCGQVQRVGLHVETAPAFPCLPGVQGAQDSEGQLKDASWRPADLISCYHDPTPMMIDVKTESQRGVVSDSRPHNVLLLI